MAYLTHDQVLGADDLVAEDVEVPEWGGTVRVRMLTGTERDAFEEAVHGDGKKNNLANFRARLAALCMVDEQGNRLFGDNEVKQLGKKSSAALSRVFNVAIRLNKFSKTDVDELAGNS